jgi:hypothetical protein
MSSGAYVARTPLVDEANAMLRRKQRTAHFIAHWGAPSDIHLDPNDPLLAVLEFPAAGDRRSFRYATNGVSEHLFEAKGGPVRFELFGSTCSSRDWMAELLLGLARYAVSQAAYLGEFDTVPVSRWIDRATPSYAGLLIAPPSKTEAETIGAIGHLSREPVLVHQAVGLYGPELEYAIAKGGESLFERLAALGGELLLDAPRPVVV